MELKRRLEQVVGEAFEADGTFAQAQRDATEAFINSNSRGGRPAELLAKFIDGLLRGGKDKKARSEEEVEAGLDNALTLFRHL